MEGPALTKRRRIPLTARLVARLAAVRLGAEPPAVFALIARHRRLFRWWLPFAGTVLLHSTLPREDVELVVLRTVWNSDCWYEWVEHILLGGRRGLDLAMLERVTGSPLDHQWTRRQRLLLEATDELHDNRVITIATWSQLAEELDERQLVDLCFLVGHYEMLAMLINSAGLEPGARARRSLPPGPAASGERIRRVMLRTRGADTPPDALSIGARPGVRSPRPPMAG